MDKRQEWLNKLGELRQNNSLPVDIEKILLQAVIDWFEYFQWDEDREKMTMLYSKLIVEEMEEIYNAWYDKDIIGLIDGYIDQFWVMLWYDYFAGQKIEENYIEEYRQKKDIPYELFYRWLIEVAYSNWTKSREKIQDWEKKGKIIKGKDFVKPDWDFVFNKLTK